MRKWRAPAAVALYSTSVGAGMPPLVTMLLRKGIAFWALFSTMSMTRKSRPFAPAEWGRALMTRTPPVGATPVSVTAARSLHATTLPAMRQAAESWIMRLMKTPREKFADRDRVGG